MENNKKIIKNEFKKIRLALRDGEIVYHGSITTFLYTNTLTTHQNRKGEIIIYEQ